jgi:hypothetical protein
VQVDGDGHDWQVGYNGVSITSGEKKAGDIRFGLPRRGSSFILCLIPFNISPVFSHAVSHPLTGLIERSSVREREESVLDRVVGLE